MEQGTTKQLYAINPERHGSRNWRKPAGFAHAAGDVLIIVGTQEMLKAVPHAALAFALVEDRYVTVMVQGFEAGRNLLLTTDGRWIYGPIPMSYQLYPFQLVRNENGELLVCVDEASGLVGEQGSGEEFFAADKQSSPALQEVIDKLAANESDKEHNRRACAVLHRHNLFEEWRLKTQSAEGEDGQDIVGLYRINEVAFNELPADAMMELRSVGALPIVFAQLFSMQNIHRLADLKQRHEALERQRAEKAAPAVNLNQSETISFDNLR